MVGLLYLPFLDHGRIPLGSLGTYVHSFRFNGPVFATLEQVASPQLVAGLAVLVGSVRQSESLLEAGGSGLGVRSVDPLNTP